MIIGIDLGGTKILTAVADKNGKVIASVKVDTQAKLGPKKVIDNLKKSVTLALDKANIPLSRISCIGVGAPGPIIGDGTIVSPPNLPGWKKVDIKKLLEKMFRKRVVVENDANAAALAELMFGAGKHAKNLLYITISTGIGGGIIINRKIYRGSFGIAGEIGHMNVLIDGPRCKCGNRGCLEAVASGPSIARFAGKNDALAVEISARKGDKRSLEAIGQAAKHIGTTVGSVNNLLDLDMIVIGGGVANMGDLLFKPIRKWASKCAMSITRKHLKIVPAKLKTNVGVMGAIAICLKGSPDEARRAKSGDE
jgi:glucokinase